MVPLNPLDYPICFSLPRRLTPFSAWHEHIPFAMFLVSILKPRVIVELGTQYGDSYCAFCQAVQELKLDCKCYAVDTWTGDPHAGFYGPEVLSDLRQHHDPLYGAFSFLIQSTFDEALEHFADGTIDLLHIDGYHTYESVKHDFESWRPKLSSRGVVLLHDTNVRRSDFGVWKFWDEIKTVYPHFEFLHGHGLGVLAIGPDCPEELMAVLNAPEEVALGIRNFFFTLGRQLSNSVMLQKWQIEKRSLEGRIKQLQLQIEREQAEKEAVFDERDRLEVQLAERKHYVSALEQNLMELSNCLATKEKEYVQARAYLEAQVAERDQTVVRLRRSIDELRRQLTEKDAKLLVITNSLGWRITQKYRGLMDRLFPLQTGRRKYYEIAQRCLKIALTENPSTLIRMVGQSVVYRFGSARRVWPKRVSRANEVLSVGEVRDTLPLQGYHEPVDIVICIHNALDDVKRCLQSVVEHTSEPYRLILVNDGSDATTSLFLEEFCRTTGATLVTNEVARGYTCAANQGLRQSTADYVILLNSDTVVTPEWLDRMIQCANSDVRIGIVGPLSNCASWQSVPKIEDSGDWAENPLSEGFSIDDVGRLIAKYSARLYPRVPLLNGFCLLLKRRVIEEVGYFDEIAFGEGYGEENDYCFRAQKAGFDLAVADDVFIYHAQSRSYSHEKRKALCDRANQMLISKYGSRTVDDAVNACRYDRIMEGIRVRAEVMIDRENLVRLGRKSWSGKRVLFLLPVAGPGGGANVVIQEARAMRAMGVEAVLLNLRTFEEGFSAAYPRIDVPVIYSDVADIGRIASDFDVVIATANYSVEWLEFVPSDVIRCYYVQDFEPYFYEAGSPEFWLAWNSYTRFRDLVRVTKTEWNREEVKRQIGEDCYVVGPSVNIDLFRPRRRSRSSEAQLWIAAMVRPSSARRAPRLTMEVLQETWFRFRDRVRLVVFGCSENDPSFRVLPRNFAYHNVGVLSPPKMAWLLNEIDIFVDLSEYQAMGLTALEAMACGCAVIVPQKGGAGSFAVDQINSLIVDTSSKVSIMDALARLITDRDLRSNIQRQAIRDACKWPPEKAAYNMLKVIFSGWNR